MSWEQVFIIAVIAVFAVDLCTVTLGFIVWLIIATMLRRDIRRISGGRKYHA